ncbi:mannitol dehydrogenase family protein [Solimonas terrae]|uniref:Mannitol dehydrogenase family protein n=1 Tax=Solimonas terrae TaxID=1396819 RepID=A0A6M2BNQ6_9GAMM|nr:mannitol dehydrogenase family protein [Solimonas terrae]NGY04108.1 mannitol dehydrogenase family protein [Solimonas terrae]
MKPLLRNNGLAQLRELRVDGAPAELPGYERRLRKRICHIGVGAFHRAHQAWYLHRLLQQGEGEGWGLCGIGLRAADRATLDALGEQDGLYSLWEIDESGRRVTVVGSIMDQLDASSDCSAAIARLADADTHIVSLTVTEAGYCLNGETLDVHHPDVVHDLADPAQPRSAPGLLVAALAQRRANGLPPFTAMSCDNLVKNGERLRSAVLAFARLVDPALAQWIESRGCFPCSMVDRITPAMDAARRERLCEDWGVDDRVPVICEPWQQWIIEDHFVCGRPAFERVGVVFSDDVTRYEDMKVGLLNGGHSAISHLGLLLGYESVHEALADPVIRAWHAGYMREVSATLSPLPDVDYAEYERALTRRFSNAAIQDRLLRLAMDSSTKFPQVLLPPVLRRLDAGLSVDFLATAIALWLVYLDGLGRDDKARSAYVDHDVAGLIALASAAVAEQQPGPFLAARLPITDARAARFEASVSRQLASLRDAGARAHVERLLAPSH